MKCPKCGKEMRTGYLFTSKDGAFSFANEVPGNPMKAECFLPIEVDKLLQQGKATVEVLSSKDKWFGVTYKEDKPFVMESIARLKADGVYPDVLW